jgi:hypothetical protein
MKEGWEPIATILGYHVELKGENPFGEVKSSWIKLRSPLMPLSMSDMPEKDGIQRNLRLKTPWGEPFGTHAGFDNINQTGEGAEALVTGLELFALVLVRTEKSDQDKGVLYHALIVIKDEDISSGDERMKRMGFIILSDNIIGKSEAIGDSAGFATVTLV